MSYNYEINDNNSVKKYVQSKYTCRTNENDSQTYIFEIILKNKSNNYQVIRCIKNANQGKIITNDDYILYDTIVKYKITLINVKHPNDPIIIKNNFDSSLTTNTHLNDDVYLEMNQTMEKYLEMTYNIISRI